MCVCQDVYSGWRGGVAFSGGEGADRVVFGGSDAGMRTAAMEEKKQENRGEKMKVHIPRKWACVFYEISLKEAIIIIGK